MAQIPKTLGSGGFGLYPNSGSNQADLLTILQGIGADLSTLQVATIAAADVDTVASTDADTATSADATDLATAISLVNELKADYNSAVSLVNEQKADYNIAVILLNEIKGVLNTVAGATLVTTVEI